MSNVLNIVGAHRGPRRRVGVGETRGTGEFRQELCSDGVWRVMGSCPVPTSNYNPPPVYGNPGMIDIPHPEVPNRPYVPIPLVPPPVTTTVPHPDPYYPPPVPYEPPPPGTNGGGGYPPPPGGCSTPVNVCPENQKRYVMPFEPSSGYTATVAAAATTVWQGKPQKLFKPDRLIIASTIAPYFNVTDFRIANIPQTLSAGAVAADIYSEVSTYTEMSFDQAYPGIDIILTAVNKSSVTQTFQAQLIGWLVG